MFKTISKFAAHAANVVAFGALVTVGVSVFTDASVEAAMLQSTHIDGIDQKEQIRPRARPIQVQPEAVLPEFSDAQVRCLAKNIFFEARNQSTLGQVAVAWVTLNRLESSSYNDTICSVVKQGPMDGSPISLHRCQFSWYCDGLSDNIPDNVVAQRAWEDVQLVAEVVIYDFLRDGPSPVMDAVMYHADYVNPFWAASYDRVVTIDDHLFYN
jgi:spore germination cell wall hydrolase CwlJ-like protein